MLHGFRAFLPRTGRARRRRTAGSKPDRKEVSMQTSRRPLSRAVALSEIAFPMLLLMAEIFIPIA